MRDAPALKHRLVRRSGTRFPQNKAWLRPPGPRWREEPQELEEQLRAYLWLLDGMSHLTSRLQDTSCVRLSEISQLNNTD